MKGQMKYFVGQDCIEVSRSNKIMQSFVDGDFNLNFLWCQVRMQKSLG